MKARATFHAPERLLAESEWLIRLAQGLVASPDDAADLAQDTFTAALARPPDFDRPVRPWLARIAKNLSITHGVSRARREARERDAARHELLSSTADVVERVSMQRTVVEAVLALDEPYRSTILLRYWDDLPPRTIAERARVPVETVRTRLKRGIAMLRERLDQRHGGRTTWLSALTPIAHGLPLTSSVAGSTAMASTTGVLAMSTGLKTSLGVLVAVALFLVGRELLAPPATTAALALASPSGEVSSPSASKDEVDVGVAASEDTLRSPATVEASSAGQAPSAAISRTITGTVVDANSNPVPSLAIDFCLSNHGAAIAIGHGVSDGGGQFEIKIGEQGGTLRAADKAWTTLFEPRVRVPGPTDGYVLVVAPKRPLLGHVVDESGSAVAAAEVRIDCGSGQHSFEELDMSDAFRMSIKLPLDWSVAMAWTAKTDAAGFFQMQDAPDLPQFLLEASAKGYMKFRAEVRSDQGPIVVVLSRPRTSEGLLKGRVVQDSGAPAIGAAVLLGSLISTSDRQGEFALDLSHWDGGLRLAAVQAGWEPAVQPCLADSPSAPGAWPEPLVLRLERRTVPLRGRVIDENGAPLERVELRVLDVVTYREIAEEFGEPTSNSASDWGNGRTVDGERTVSNSKGEFEIPMLSQRACRLRAVEPASRCFAVTDPVAPGGGGVTITLSIHGPRAAVGGHVVDLRGKPIAGARVIPYRLIPEPGPHAPSPFDLGSVVTDSEGRFQLGEIALPLDCIGVQPEELAPGTMIPIDRNADYGSLTLAVGLLGHIQIEIVSASLQGDSVAVLDAAGQRLQLGARRGDLGWVADETMPVSHGRSEPLLVLEDARTAVLLKDRVEIARVPVVLEPGKSITIRF